MRTMAGGKLHLCNMAATIEVAYLNSLDAVAQINAFNVCLLLSTAKITP